MNPASITHVDAAHPVDAAVRLVPGLLLCLGVSALAVAGQRLESALTGRAWIEALVLAIAAGVAIRAAWAPGERWRPGITFSANLLLEIAVMLLGASVDSSAMAAAGGPLLVAIVTVVIVAILVSVAIGRLLGLSPQLAVLVACGNSICGNSAIAAVAPVIAADNDDVTTAIAFTAVLGVAAIFALPLLGLAIGMNAIQFGALAGLTVYAVPQVLAAASPFGATAIRTATLVKLVRVLMLGPVCVALSLTTAGGGDVSHAAPPLHKLIPWFILGFVALAAARALALIPPVLLAPTGTLTTGLMVMSMAALGLFTDVRTMRQAGGRVILAGLLSLGTLVGLSLAALALIGLA